jgi:diphthamide biosynthesis protein 7
MTEEEGKPVRSLRSQILDLPPSCVEFCPAFPSYFLVGTYSLQPDGAGQNKTDTDIDADSDAEGDGQPTAPKQPQSRNGSIMAFQLSDGAM